MINKRLVATIAVACCVFCNRACADAGTSTAEVIIHLDQPAKAISPATVMRRLSVISARCAAIQSRAFPTKIPLLRACTIQQRLAPP